MPKHTKRLLKWLRKRGWNIIKYEVKQKVVYIDGVKTPVHYVEFHLQCG